MAENWKRVGEIMEAMVEAEMYPGIGFCEDGWRAWVFLNKEAEEARVYEGTCAPTVTEAIEQLVVRLMEIGKDMVKEVLALLEETSAIHRPDRN